MTRRGVKFLNSLFFLGASAAFFLVFSVNSVCAEEGLIIEVLEQKGCSHCLAEKKFLLDLAKSRKDLTVRFYDVGGNGKEIFEQITLLEGLSKATPITIVGETILQGFDAPETTGKRIEALLGTGSEKKQYTFAEYLSRVGESDSKTERVSGAVCEDGTFCPPPKSESFVFRLPFSSRTIDVSSYSLPTLSITLGFIDGFNPCAMWVLVTFLILLAQTGSRKKLLQIAGLFVIAETIMYYLILNVWFTTWNFIGLDRIVTPIVGMIAIFGGIFFLYEWYKSLGTKMACQIVDAENRSKIIRKIKSFIAGEFTLFAAIGIIGLAFSVNVIEFACSIGIPQAFTKIIELNQLGVWQTQALMVLYISFYMLDDFLVFGLAIWGFEKIHLTEKYSQWSALVGGILMLIIGYLMMFRPDIISRLS